MQPLKYLVLSWTNAAAVLVGVFHNASSARQAAEAVPLTGGTIGAGIVPLVGSENLEVVQGVAQN